MQNVFCAVDKQVDLLLITYFFLYPITMSSGNDVECVLWDECSSESYADYIMNDEAPVVVVMNLARIGFSIDGSVWYIHLLCYVHMLLFG